MSFRISDFKTTMNKFGGPARPNLFEVILFNFTNINTLYLYDMKNYDFLNIDKIKNIYFDEYKILK